MTTPSLTTLLIQRARQTSELQSYGVLTTPYVKILLRALSDRLELADRLITVLDDHEGAEGWSESLRKDLQRYAQLSAMPPQPGEDTLPPAEGLQTLETSAVHMSEGFEKYPSPQSPTAPAGEDAARPVQLVTPGESLLDAYERARQSYETASPARIDYDLRKAEFQNLHVDMVTRLQRVGLIDALRAGEGDSVTIFCDNADFGGPDNAVEVSGQWTEWEDRRFEGATLNQALTKALLAKGQADAKG